MDNCDVWSKTLEQLKKNIGVVSFKTWISNLHLVNYDNNILRLSVNSNFIKDTILAKYSDEILNTIRVYIPTIISIDITVTEDNTQQTDYLSVPGSLFNNTWTTKSVDYAQQKPVRKSFCRNIILDKKFTFENFVVGHSNEFAYATAKNVAVQNSTEFNPIFLYGGVGMGKTHLMQAIAWSIQKNQSDRTVMYVSAERFMYLFLKSLQLKDGINFKDFFEGVDVLIMDDIQFIGGKESTQEEFLYTFNKFVDNDHQIILSANRAPNELKGISNRLKSRLCGGLIVDVHPSTYELRVDILQQKAKKLKIQIPSYVIENLACNITSSVRELEGALNRLVAHATLVGQDISLDMVRNVLSDLPTAKNNFVSIETIQNSVCGSFSIGLSDMLSTTRIKTVSIARQVAMYLSKELTDYSYSEIGKLFGNRDHSTVVHAVKSIKNRIDTDSNFSENINALKKSL